MSTRLIVKTITFSLMVSMISACSFKKSDDNKDKYHIQTTENGTKKAAQLCATSNPTAVDDFQTLLSLSTSLNEEDLCTSIFNFKRKIADGTLLPADIAIFESILKTITNLAKQTDTVNRKIQFQEFTRWATTFAKNLENYQVNSIIRLNNLTSNSLLNTDLIKSDFAEKKILVFLETDHLTNNEFSSYFDSLSKKLNLAILCSDEAVKLSLGSKRFNSHTMKILERCRSHQSAQQIAANRTYLIAPVSAEEVQLLKIAIENSLISTSPDDVSRSQALVVVTSAVKRNDVRLFEMASLAFNERSILFYGLSMAKDIEYDLEKFIRDNARAISEILRHRWSSQEIVSALQNHESKVLFNLLSQYDIIPDSQQTEEVLRGVLEVRKANSETIDLLSLESLIRLLKSNTVTKFRSHVTSLNLADEEILLMVRGYRTSHEIAQHFGISFSPYEQIYFQNETKGVPEFSTSKKTKLYITGSFLEKAFFPKHYSGSARQNGLAYSTDDGNSFFLKMGDIFDGPIEEVSSRIQWGPDYLLSAPKIMPAKEVPEPVRSTFVSFVEYARAEHKKHLTSD